MNKYPRLPECNKLVELLTLQAQLQTEYGAKGIARSLARAERALRAALRELQALPIDRELAKREPNDMEAIRALRPRGPRRLWTGLNRKVYRDRLAGAFLGRMAGCTLGAPVEFWSIPKMEALAAENAEAFPPTDYWGYVPEPKEKRYSMSPREDYTRKEMRGVPVDDDTVYTLLGLLIAEGYSPEFSTADVGAAWVKYLPYACTAEDVALKNLKK